MQIIKKDGTIVRYPLTPEAYEFFVRKYFFRQNSPITRQHGYIMITCNEGSEPYYEWCRFNLNKPVSAAIEKALE